MEKTQKSLENKEESILMEKEEKFYIPLDNDLYSINIKKNKNNDKIIIKAKKEILNSIHNGLSYYENSFSLEDLINKSKPFKLCDTIDEALNIFIDILKANKAFLNQTKKEIQINNSLIFIIKISLPGGQEEDVELELDPKIMDKDEYINELIKIIEKLVKENEELKYDNAVKNNEIKLFKKKYGANIKYESNKSLTIKNRSFDTKRNILTQTPMTLHRNNLYKYGYHDIHNNIDINNIINYHTLYNSKNMDLSKINPKDEFNNCKQADSFSCYFQTSLSSFKKGKLTRNNNDKNNNTNEILIGKEHLQENKEKNSIKINNFNKSKNKKKEIQLNNIIYIKNDLNKMTMIPVDDYMSIKQIKMKYCAKKYIPLKGKELYYKGKKLSDDKNLEFYNIPWESTLYVLNIPDKINVYIRCLSGKEFKIIVDEFETILKIKFKIYEYENIPVDQQIVLINKKILDDEKMIREFNTNGDVHLIVRRKGEL